MHSSASNLERRPLLEVVHGIAHMDDHLIIERRRDQRSGHKVLDTRFWEWVFSVFPSVLGGLILVEPKIATGSILVVAFGIFGGFGLGMFLLSIGVIGIGALIANGRSLLIGPRLRVICAIFRMLTWFSFVLSMSFLTRDVGHISPMMVAFSCAAGAEIVVIYLASRHVRSS